MRQLGPGVYSEIASASANGSMTLESFANASFANASFKEGSFADSCHGPLSTIEFYPGDDSGEEPIEIEIAPGVFKRLKGSVETQLAWENKKCKDAMCFVCNKRLAVAPGCDSVICPTCRSISPVFKEEGESFSIASEDSWWLTLDGGEFVGLGIALP